MIPACLGQYSAHGDQPCAQCGYRLRCAARTKVAGFGILPHPRVAAARERAVVGAVSLGSGVEAVAEAVVARGLSVSGSVVRTGARRRVAKILSWHGLPAASFDLPVDRLASIPAADLADIRPLMAKGEPGSRVLRNIGSIATCVDPESLATLIYEVTLHVHR